MHVPYLRLADILVDIAVRLFPIMSIMYEPRVWIMYPGLRVPSALLQPVIDVLKEEYPDLSDSKAVKQARALIKDTRSGVNTHQEWIDM